MNLIVAVDKNWAIGKNGGLLFNIKEDMKFFRETTLNKVVVMGRKTLESFPNAKPLKNRINIVLTRDESYSCDGAVVVHSFDEMFDELKKYSDDDVFVIGGAKIYNSLIPYCKNAFVTEIFKEADADTFITDISKLDDWKLADSSCVKEENDIKFVFNKYVKIK